MEGKIYIDLMENKISSSEKWLFIKVAIGQILLYVPSSSDSSCLFQMLDIIQTILTFCTAAQNKSDVYKRQHSCMLVRHGHLAKGTCRGFRQSKWHF